MGEFIRRNIRLKDLGIVRTPSLRRALGYSSRQCDHGRGPTDETGGGERAGIQRRIVENGRAVLVGGSKRTSRGRGYTFLLERRCGVLVC